MLKLIDECAGSTVQVVWAKVNMLTKAKAKLNSIFFIFLNL
ncbi:hypothetical protein AB670_04094 [Chryseobacterium sp. MOF25P]|nr:hypothetical protein AB670_04094 [Chryseobacterium sp. MOF25P]OBW47535.1 hypothetical protein AB671_00278 [Chryseobacterium sp. BGARF1]